MAHPLFLDALRDLEVEVRRLKSDAYRVFARMVEKGNPPATWGELEAEAVEIARSGGS